jgi:catechol 2,3-dioxygenase-like lactoylglutathione lyase family enzyme|tara:strand:- start:3698 stop:4105 length:408 start_codon:yes stop_codon:yes gene_type:complete
MVKINFTSDTIDIGMVTVNDQEMLHFYQNVLGFEKEIEIPFPGIGVVNKLNYGAGFIKILVLEKKPLNINPTGDFLTSNGIRYLTINLSNLDEILDTCKTHNINIINPGTIIRPGVTVALIADPDGNIIELMNTK